MSSLPEPSGLREVTNHFIPFSCCCCHSGHVTICFLMSVPSFMAFVEFDPRLKMGHVFILPDKVPMAESLGALEYCTFSPSRWGYNYNLTVWVQLKVRKRYIKFAHMLVPYPHHIPLALYISYATTFGGRCMCIYVCVCTHSRVTILILQSLCKNQTPGFRVS